MSIIWHLRPRCILAFIQPFNCSSSYLEFFFKQVNASDDGFRCNKRPKFYVSSVWKWNTWRIINKWNMTSKFLPPVPWVSTAGRPTTNVDASKCYLLDISAPKLETNSKFIMFFRFTITKKNLMTVRRLGSERPPLFLVRRSNIEIGFCAVP